MRGGGGGRLRAQGCSDNGRPRLVEAFGPSGDWGTAGGAPCGAVRGARLRAGPAKRAEGAGGQWFLLLFI